MKSKNSTNIFFLELLFSIFIFIVIATICIQVFACSHSLNERTQSITFSLEKIQNEIELFYSCVALGYLPDDAIIDELYDSNWNQTDSSDMASYIIKKTYSHDNTYYYLDINTINLMDDSVILSQTVKALYLGKESD